MRAQPITKNIPIISLKKLLLTNFRSYKNLSLEIGEGSVVLTGANGSGKTNLLEAVSMLALGRGLRNATLSEQIYRDKNSSASENYSWAINANVRNALGDGLDVKIGTGIEINEDGKEKRIVKIDGESKRGLSVLGEYFSVCYLSPRMDSLFVEGATSRRAYLDKLTTMLIPEHSKHLAIYDYAKSERIRLLKRGNADNKWLNTLERRMAEKSVAIAVARKEAIAILQNAIGEDISDFPKAMLQVTGLTEDNMAHMSAIQAEDFVVEMLYNNRREDAQFGRTKDGIHKSDFVVIHSEKNFPAELCSTGEQKAILLSITLASVRAKTNWSGVVPVLLLDEVVAHLDDKKRAKLIEALEGLKAQCWMTGTDKEFFVGFQGKAQFFNVDNSRVFQ